MEKVLIVEDEEDIREGIAELLNVSGYSTITAVNGREGLELALKELPDIIISDIMMPEMDGYEFLNGLRTNKSTEFIPFLFLTAKSELGDIRKGMNLSADDYLLKPFKVEDLKKTLEVRIEKKHKMDLENSIKLNLIKEELNSMQMREKIFSSIFHLSPDIIFIFDFEINRIVFYNDHFKAIFGSLGIDQTETNLLGFIHPLDQNVYESFVFNINKLKENETINTEVRLLVNSENYKWYELTAVIFQKNVNNKLKRYLAVLRDINSKKENEIIINDFYERISFELEKASETQMTLITKKFPKIQNINFNLFFSPMEKIGGDFINYNYSEKDKIGIIFGDVTGHGISASMVSSMVILAYKLLEKRNYPPSELLFNINEYLKPLIVDHFVCCIFFEIDFQKKRLTFTNAGGPNLIIIRENKIIELPKMGLPLLIDENLDLKEYQEEIKPNDILLVFSDGLYEIFNEKNEILGYENFKKLILQSYKQKGKNFLTFLIDQCLKFNKQKIKDDMTLLCIDFGENF